MRSRRGLSTTLLSLGGLWDNSGAPKVSTPWPEDFPRTARKLERLPEDDEDKRERERLHAELKMHGISPITEAPEELITPPQQAAATLHATPIDTTPVGAGAERRMSTLSKLTSYFSGAMGSATPRKGSDDSSAPAGTSGDAHHEANDSAGLMLHLSEMANPPNDNAAPVQSDWSTSVGHPAPDGGEISPTREIPHKYVKQPKELTTMPNGDNFSEIDFNTNPFAAAPIDGSFHSHSTLWALDRRSEAGASPSPAMAS